MEPAALGTLQYWGLAPPLLIEKRDGPVLFAENSDFRYFYRNLFWLHQDVYFHERSALQTARYLVKLAFLWEINKAENVAAKLEIAYAYSELHGNIRVSEASIAWLRVVSAACLGLFSVKFATPATYFLESRVGLDFLKSTQRDELYDVLSVFAGRCKAASVFSKYYKTYSVAESFDRRLRDLQTVPYDARHRVCLWAYHFDLAPKLPFTHEIYYASFRIDGVAYLKPYFRMPEFLGGKERLKAVGRRAPSEAESRMYCGIENPFCGAAFTGELLLGPWMETGFDWVLRGYSDDIVLAALQSAHSNGDSAGYQPESIEGAAHVFTAGIDAIREELYRSFTPTGPESFEPIITCVELQAVNLILIAEAFAQFHNKVYFTFGDFQYVYKRSIFDAFFKTVFCSIEAARLLDYQEMIRVAHQARCICELAEYVPEYKQRPAFEQKMLGLVRNGVAVSCGHGFAGQLRSDGKPYVMYNTHVIGEIQ